MDKTTPKKPKFPMPDVDGYGGNGMRASSYSPKAVKRYAAARVKYELWKAANFKTEEACHGK